MVQVSEIKIINPVNFTGWNDLILQINEYSIFHSSQWAKLLSNSYGYNPCYFVIEKERRISAAVPMMIINSFISGRRMVSLPYTDFCKPLLTENISFCFLFDEIVKFGKKENLNYIEFKDDKQLNDSSHFTTFHYRHKLSLCKSEDEIFSDFRKGTKSSIKKAIKEGVTVQIDNSFESVEKFCKMNQVTRKKHGLPPQPTSFFTKLYKYIIGEGSGFVVLAKKENQTVAGAIYLTFGKKVLYKYSASYPQYQNLMANNLVMWEAIKHSINNKYEEMDFGITESENEGLRIYKNGWGVEESQVYLYKYDLKKDEYVEINTRVTGFHNKIFNKAPIPLLKLFSSIFYKHYG